MKPRRLSFSALLPLAALAFWTQVIPAPAGLLYYQWSHKVTSPVKRTMPEREQGAATSRIQLATLALDAVAARRAHIVMAANLPGGVGEILISLATSWPYTWHPPNLLPDSWNGLCYPFFCLPAWWLVGRALDCLLRHVRLPFWLLSLGSALSALFTFLLLGLSFGLPASDRRGIGWLLMGFAFWAAAFCVLPFTWLYQRKNLIRHNSLA